MLFLEIALIWLSISMALVNTLWLAGKLIRLLQLKWYIAPVAAASPSEWPLLKRTSGLDAVLTGPVATVVDTVLTLDVPAAALHLRPPKADQPETLPKGGWRPAQISWQIAGLTDVGLERELNEDNLLLMETELLNGLPCGLYVVADGIGGQEAGEVASQVTVHTIEMHFTLHPPTSVAAFDTWLTTAALAANEAVWDRQADRPEQEEMGSTLVMALVVDGQAYIANVGDSRAYHLSRDSIHQISVDHSLVEHLIQTGQLTREAARTYPLKNVIYNSIDGAPDLEVDLYHVSLPPGDRLLLCSDGLSGMLTDEVILAISRRQANPTAACRALVEAALLAGGHDNITAIMVQMEAA